MIPFFVVSGILLMLCYLVNKGKLNDVQALAMFSIGLFTYLIIFE